MKDKLFPVGILLWPSIRSIAYLSIFRELNIYPSEIIWMENKIGRLAELRNEAVRFGYEKFFDIYMDLQQFVKNDISKVFHPGTSDINSPEVLQILSRCNSKNFIYTGGGIIDRETLNLGKQFIHVHPGIIPEYRGSTCFYYSLMKDFSLGTTAFFMNEKIDAGDIILQLRFKLNYNIRPDQPLFMDYVLDPYIRAVTLKRVLCKFILSEEIETRRYNCNDFAYYVMHPLLRHLTVNRINHEFREDCPIAIFEMEG